MRVRSESIESQTTRGALRRRPGPVLAWAMLLTLGLAACGEGGLMEGLGDRSHEYVQGSSTTTTPLGTEVATTMPAAIPVEGVTWYNQGIEGETVGEVNYVVSAVWARGQSEGRFIQASPAEIAEALPGVQFPSLLPRESGWVTSQLVYDAASATLDAAISAAFGLWAVEPYTEGEGRLAVLRIGMAIGGSQLDSTPVSAPADDGISLTWTDGTYRYELSCRQQVPESQCWQAAESMLPLEVVGPGPVVANG